MPVYDNPLINKSSLYAKFALPMLAILTGCSSNNKYDSWSECMSEEIYKNKNIPAAEAYCDANYDMSQREATARHAWACKGREWASECGSSATAIDAMATEAAPAEDHSTEQNHPTSGPLPNIEPPTLAEYDGRYPWDKIKGFSILEHPLIASAINKLPLDRNVKKFINSRSLVSGGISVRQWNVEVDGCKPHKCPIKNWKLEYHINEGSARICYYDAEGPESLNRWQPDGTPTREGDCM